ncbi:MAG: Fic family protein [Thermoleophilia bacterium]
MSFIHYEEGLPALIIKAGLAHVQFETIHPFLDGSGRVGRLLIALMLHVTGVLHQPLLYLSVYSKQHRSDYYRLLEEVRLTGDWELWVDFFLEGVVETAGAVVDTALRLRALFDEDAGRVQALGRGAGSALRVFEALRGRPVASITMLASLSALTYPTVAQAVTSLSNLGIVDEITGRRRDRVFAYRRYLDILNEGAGEPL